MLAGNNISTRIGKIHHLLGLSHPAFTAFAMITRSAALELVGHDIRVNSLTPTATEPSEALERAAPLAGLTARG